MLNRFNNRNILITGAGSGIGRAAALRIASEGGNLALIDVNTTNLMAVTEELAQYDVNVVSVACNVASFLETKQAIDEMSDALGGIHGLSHNAGIMRCYHTHEMTSEQWQELMDVNLTGTFHVNRHAIPHLLKNDRSYLVNTSSIAIEQPHPWMSAYAATKGAIQAFTRSIFIEYFQQGLHANCILPGSVKSDLSARFQVPEGANRDLVKTLIPLGESRLVDPTHVAGAIAFLMSDDAIHVNGTELTIDGGRIY